MAAETEKAAPEKLIRVGRISGVYGVKGWLKVYSYTEPRKNVIQYSPWQLRLAGTSALRAVVQGREQGKGVVVQLEGCNDRDAALGLIGAEIEVLPEQLPKTGAGEYYWHELVGLKVLNQKAVEFGTVQEMMATGANDVMVVKGDKERLIPYLTHDVVMEVNLKEGFVKVDWDPDF